MTAAAPLRIAVVGCGTAGPAVATLLARRGHSVDIYERARPLRPIGAGLLLQPTGMSVLHAMGLLPRALQLGHRITSLRGDTSSGRPVLRLSYQDLAPGLFGLGIHRGALFSLLLDAARAQPGVTVHEGIDVDAVVSHATSAGLRTREGKALGPFDLILIADGARSALRPGVAVRSRSRAYPYAAAWCVLPMPDSARWRGELRQVMRDTRRMVGYLPSGRPAPGEPETISLFWSLPAADIPILRAEGVDSLRRGILDLDPAAAELLTALRDPEQVLFATYHDTVCRPVYDARIVLLGDAAHAMSPQLGQGANLALLDALHLAECLAQKPGDVPAALRAHDLGRRANVVFYARASRWLTPWFQSSHSWLAPARDLLFHPLSRIPPLRREMARSLAGIKTGLFTCMPLFTPPR